MSVHSINHVRNASEQYGYELSDDEIEAYAAELDAILESFENFDPADPVDEPAEDVNEGEDEYNALRQTFSLSVAKKTDTLAGLKLGVKENMAVAGVPMTCGSDAFSVVPGAHSTVVRRLAEAGGDVCATTNMDEFAFWTTSETCAYGPIDNPAAPDRVPGGSSGGSGAAVAAGILDAALGSDTGGSVRIPASYCGVVGLKPTHAAVSRSGFVDLAPSLDHIGVLANSVATTARVFQAIAGPDARDPSTRGMPPREEIDVQSDIDTLSIGVIEEGMADATDPVREEVNSTVEDLADAGVEVDQVSLPTLQETAEALLTTAGIEFARLIADEGQVYGIGTGYNEALRTTIANLPVEKLGENVYNQLLLNSAVLDSSPAQYYIGAQRVRETFIAEVEDTMANYDGLVLPTTPQTAPSFGTITDQEGFVRTFRLTGPFNFTGHPALSVPCGEVDGRPVGFQIVTDRHDEATALSLGAAVENS